MNFRYFLELVGLAALWGASFLFMRIAVPEFGPIWLSAIRVLIAGLVLLPILIYQGFLADLRKTIFPVLLLGGINSALPFLGFAFATTFLTGGFTSILNATAPLFGVLLVIISGNIKTLSRAQMVGFLVGFLGVAILIGLRPMQITTHFWLAVAAGLSGALLYAISANFIKLKLTGVPSMVIAAGSQISASLWLLPLLPFKVPAAFPSLKAILALFALALFSTALAYLIYFRLIRLVGATRSLTVTYLIPAFAMLWGALILHEPVTGGMVFGCGVILLGTALANGLFNKASFVKAQNGLTAK
ncbi:DMT family transporter [Thiolinea disciformis]|uniref:DMT family transporter n=1 Tax=Thiolinea disciformis TaxID=125614 RepID=UPI00035C3685|nr:DMT family transporter [Thiolinea disciformis]